MEKRRITVIWVTAAMVFSFIGIIVEIAPIVKAPTTWYVDDMPGGGGPGDPLEDFTSIQDAINASSDGDIVFVYNGTYYENVIVNRTINLIGENRNSTVINGSWIGNVVLVSVNWVNVSGFTILNGGSGFDDAGIHVDSSYNTFSDNNITLNDDGIYLDKGSNNTITGNTFSFSVRAGIFLNLSNVNIITGNSYLNNGWDGILLNASMNNSIENNYFMNNGEGITFFDSNYNNVTKNNFSNDIYGIDMQNSNFNNIVDNNISSQDYGLLFTEVHHLNIINNHVIAPMGGIDLCNLYYSNVINNTVTSSMYGIMLWSFSHNNSVNNNNVTDCYYGISIYGCSGDTSISNNSVVNNTYGIIIIDTHVSNISDNIISENGEGIYLKKSSNNSFINNDFSNCTYGIYGEFSSYNTLADNSFSFSGAVGIFLEESNNTVISENDFINSTWGGIAIYLSSNNSVANNDFLNNLEGVTYSECYYSDIINNTFSNEEYGIDVQNCNYIDIRNNIVDSRYYGLHIFNIIGLNVTNNYVSAQWCAIDLSNSYYGYIANNTIANCTEEGINIWSSSEYNIISNNSFYNNSYAFWIDGSENNIILNNIFWNNSYSLFVWECSAFNITKNHFFNNEYGIYFWEDVYSCNITNNNISDNVHGIYLDKSNNDYNLIWENLVINNEFGINISQSNNNIIYHNNFINNTYQANDDSVNKWDNDYPVGGNYWADYTGVDFYKGPKQNIPGADGIGDTNYTIDIDSVDNYPLMVPYTFKQLENYTILKQGWNLISIPLIQENQNITKVLEMIDGYYNIVQWYDASDPADPWKNYVVGKPFGNDLLHINETMGFWIHITQPGNTIFLYNGTQPTVNQTIQLYEGWNLVGYPSLMSYNRTEGLNNLTFDTHIDSIWTYYAETQEWKELGPSDYFELERGYWVHAKTECEWEVPI